MNKAQRKRLAGYFADISKVVLAIAVAGPLINRNVPDFIITIFSGIIVGAMFLVLALWLEKQTDGGSNE